MALCPQAHPPGDGLSSPLPPQTPHLGGEERAPREELRKGDGGLRPGEGKKDPKPESEAGRCSLDAQEVRPGPQGLRLQEA